MKSKQINFYLLPKEFKRLMEHIKKNDMLMIGSPMESKDFEFVESAENHTYNLLYIFRKSDLEQIKTKPMDKENHYYIDVLASPVIELHTGVYNKKENYLTRGRLFFVAENDGKAKSEEFLQTANKLIKWFKKNYKNSETKNYKPVIVSKKVNEWIVKESGELIKN